MSGGRDHGRHVRTVPVQQTEQPEILHDMHLRRSVLLSTGRNIFFFFFLFFMCNVRSLRMSRELSVKMITTEQHVQYVHACIQYVLAKLGHFIG